MRRLAPILLAALLVPVFAYGLASEEEYNRGASLSGPTFRILDPQHAGFGGTASSSSPSFRLLGTIGDLGIGLSSASSFGLRAGFLYFPVIVAPTFLTATPGTGQVTLTWNPGDAQAGLDIGGYNLCTKPNAGSYTCQNVGLVTTFLKTGLAGGNLHTFRVEMYDAYGTVIARSDEIQATPGSSGGGGGGGGGGYIPPSTGLEVTGLAYPNATVHVLVGGTEITTLQGRPDGYFSVTRAVNATGTTNLGFWAMDTDGRRSITWAFAVNVINARPNGFSGIIIPPTIVVTPTTGQPGTALAVTGQSAPGATVRVEIVGTGRAVTVVANGSGRWSTTLSTTGLSAALYSVRARTELLPSADTSTWSQLVQVGLGVPLPLAACNHPPDVNGSGRVDLVDFSVMAFWWRKPLPVNSPVDLNCDAALTLADFSILAYHWTGR